MRWIVAIVAVEGIVEIMLHSELFAWFRRFRFPLFNCGWCLSVWVATGTFILIILDIWWLLIPIAIHRFSNVFHEIYGRLRA